MCARLCGDNQCEVQQQLLTFIFMKKKLVRSHVTHYYFYILFVISIVVACFQRRCSQIFEVFFIKFVEFTINQSFY